ncbi:MAG: PQQ-binding-like beta-propeller repeat protein, partial [Patescibacteria group bacterium]|nr:PQQ-binding-like beta-propeller repeat protein [Patescibacteria group bacterium]
MKYSSIAGLVLILASAAHAQNWPHWRGPSFDGSTEAGKLPANWSTTENVVWSVPLPGAAASTPIVWEERVFLSGVDEERGVLEVRCHDRRDGGCLWRHDVPGEPRRDYRSNYASNSPVTDGEVVVFFFGNGQLLGYDLDGKQLWSRDLQKDYGSFAFLWTFAASPTLWKD